MNIDETQEIIQADYLDEIEIRLSKDKTAKVEIFRKHIGLEIEKDSDSDIDSQYLYLALTKSQAKSLMNLLTIAITIQEKLIYVH